MQCRALSAQPAKEDSGWSKPWTSDPLSGGIVRTHIGTVGAVPTELSLAGSPVQVASCSGGSAPPVAVPTVPRMELGLLEHQCSSTRLLGFLAPQLPRGGLAEFLGEAERGVPTQSWYLPSAVTLLKVLFRGEVLDWCGLRCLFAG